jgi:LacI family gluconate utilization system Gnt-I transcriptional repressor
VVEGANLTDTPIHLAVGTRNEEAARAVMRHLIGRYGLAIGFAAASPKDNDRMRDRRAGYLAALRQARGRPDPAWMVECPMTMAGGHEAIARLLALPKPPRAVFCGTDVIAAGAIQECVRRGIAVPETIAIAGYDDLEIAAELVPALTTVRMPRYEIGQVAARLMDACLDGRQPAERVHDLGYTLIERDSA